MNRINCLNKCYNVFFIALFLCSGVIPIFRNKILEAFLVWIGIFFLIFSIGISLKEDTKKIGKSLYCVLLIFALVWSFRAIFLDSSEHFSGTPLLTIFGSLEFGIFTYLLPLAFLFSEKNIISILYKRLSFVIVISFILFLINYSSIVAGKYLSFLSFSICSILFIPFLLYIRKRYLQYCLMFFLFSIICFLLIGERAILIYFSLSLLGFFGVKMHFLNIAWSLILLAGISVSLAILIYSLYYGVSIFEILQDLYFDTNDMAQDTRSFIFYELSEDLTRNHEWIYGKGMLGVCYSPFFDSSTNPNADSAYRIGLEVGFLQYLLKGGLLYLSLIMLTFLGAIYNAFFKSKSKFIKTIGVLLFVNFVILCISYTPSFNMWYFHIWIMIGMCYSNKFLKLSDNEIKTIINSVH